MLLGRSERHKLAVLEHVVLEDLAAQAEELLAHLVVCLLVRREELLKQDAGVNFQGLLFQLQQAWQVVVLVVEASLPQFEPQSYL